MRTMGSGLNRGAEAVDEWVTVNEVEVLERRHGKRLVEHVNAALADYSVRHSP
jgi:hypothetical protein